MNKGIPKSLISELKELGDKLYEFTQRKEELLIVTHYDADGLSAGALFSLLLKETDTPFHLRVLEQISDKDLASLPLQDYKNIVFLDMGSGYKEKLSKLTLKKRKNIIIIDHHIPSKYPREGIIELNPYNYGIDASSDVSTSGIVYLLFSLLTDNADKYSYLGIVGALGDRQDQGKKFSLKGINKIIVEKAKQVGIIEEKIGLRLFGLSHRPIVKALAYTMDPYIPGLSGDETACYRFLQRIGISPIEKNELRTVSSLSYSEIRKLATELIKHMLSVGIPLREAERIFGTNYYIILEPQGSPLRDTREFAYILNANGRMGYYGTAIGLCIGIKGKNLVRALNTVSEYRRKLSYVMNMLRREKENYIKIISDKIIWINLGEIIDPKIVGAIASLFSTYNDIKEKIVLVAANKDENIIKVSARSLDPQINIGEILSRIATSIGIEGGGHSLAGGALVEKNQVDIFLDKLSKELS